MKVKNHEVTKVPSVTKKLPRVTWCLRTFVVLAAFVAVSRTIA